MTERTLADYSADELAHAFAEARGRVDTERERFKKEWNGAAPALNGKTEPYDYTDMSAWEIGGSPEPLWTVPGVIPAGHMTLFSGPGATGKSTIMLQLACAHALGKDWINWMPEPGPVIYCDAEDDNTIIYRRLDLILQHYGATFNDLIKGGLHVMSLAGKTPIMVNGKLELTALYRKIAADIERIRPIQIIIANSANVFAGNEIDRVQVGHFVHTMTALVTGTARSLVLISHPSLTGIASGTGLSGSTQWYNAARAQMYLKRKTNGDEEEDDKFNAPRELSFKKNQYGPEARPVVLKWQKGLYLPVAGSTTLETAHNEAQAEERIREALADGNLNLSSSSFSNSNYLPKRLAGDGVAFADLKAVMLRLLKEGKLKVESRGFGQSKRQRLVLAEEPPSSPPS